MDNYIEASAKGRRFDGIHYTIIQIFYWMLICCYYAFGASYFFEMGLSGSLTGLVFALVGAFSALTQTLVASLADRHGGEAPKRLSIALALPACALLALLSFSTQPQWLGIALYALVWVLIMALQFLISSLGMDSANAGIKVNFGISRAFGSAFYALTAYSLGVLSAAHGARISVPIAAVVSALLLISLFFWRSAPRIEKEPFEKEAAALRGSGFFSRYPRFAIFVCGATLCLTAYCTTCNYMVRIVEALGGGSKELGTSVMMTAICEIPTILISVWLSKKFGSNRLLIISAAMLTVRMLLLTLARSISFLYGVMLIQLISYSLFIPVSVYYVDALMRERDRLMGQAMMTLIPTIGNSIGSILGGFLLDTVQVRGMLLCCALISFIGSAVMIYGTERGDMRRI